MVWFGYKGTTSIIEVARAFSRMYDMGWRPKRNIYFLSWDAEEFDLIGSTEYGEDEEEMVKSQVVAYFNQDVAVSGPYFGISTDPMMELLAIDSMKQVVYPGVNQEYEMSVYQHWIDQGNTKTGMLGSGSDYTVFVHEYGITSMDSRFTAGGGGYGTYHSIYDSYFVMSNYIDPGYHFLKAEAQVVGLMGFECVNNDLLPFNLYNLVNRIEGFIENEISLLSVEYNCRMVLMIYWLIH